MNRLLDNHIEEIKNSYNNLFSNIGFINRGGCGIFAKFLYQRLQECGYKPRLVVHFSTTNESCPDAKERVRQLEKKNNADCSTFSDNEVYWEHISVQVGRHHFDSTGFIETPKRTECFFISKETLDKMVAQTQYWYYAFDRRDTHRIKKQFQKAFF